MKRTLALLFIAIAILLLQAETSSAQDFNPNGSHWVIVTNGPLNIRTCASRSCPVISDPIRNDLIRIIPTGGRAKVIGHVQAIDSQSCLDENCTWYQVDEGFIHSGYVEYYPDPNPLPTNPCPEENVCVVVDLPSQSLHLYQHGVDTLTTWVSTGYREGSTPVGSHRVLWKTKTRHMRGGIGANAYDLDKVLWVSYFTTNGVAFHGTYWHYAFGTVGRSHGCVNMTAHDARVVYDLLEVGTLIIVR